MCRTYYPLLAEAFSSTAQEYRSFWCRLETEKLAQLPLTINEV